MAKTRLFFLSFIDKVKVPWEDDRHERVPPWSCITYSKGKDQPGTITNPARGQLNCENIFFPVPVRD